LYIDDKSSFSWKQNQYASSGQFYWRCDHSLNTNEETEKLFGSLTATE